MTSSRAAAVEALAFTGYGHFTTVHVIDGCVRGWRRHLSRLRADCRTVFGHDLSDDLVREALRTTLGSEPRSSLLARLTVCAPGMAVDTVDRPTAPIVVVSTRPAPASPLPPLALTARTADRSPAAVKHTGLFSALHARRDARLSGYDDALLLTGDGRVGEGPTWTIGFFDGERVVWPQAERLASITADLVTERMPYASTTRALTTADIEGMPAAFAVGSGIGVRAVRTIDAQSFDPAHPVIDGLRDSLERVPLEKV